MVMSLRSILISHIYIPHKLSGILSNDVGRIIPLYSMMRTLWKDYALICPLFIIQCSFLLFFISFFLLPPTYTKLLSFPFSLTFTSLFVFSSWCLPTAFQEIITFQCGGSRYQWNTEEGRGLWVEHILSSALIKRKAWLSEKKKISFQVFFLFSFEWSFICNASGTEAGGYYIDIMKEKYH